MTSSTARLAATAGPTAQTAPPSQPWWRHGHVWLVIAGPVTVVIAGIATAVVAIRSPDPLVAEDYYRRGIEINKTLGQGADAKALLPAVQARNHAATPAGAIPAPSAAPATVPVGASPGGASR